MTRKILHLIIFDYRNYDGSGNEEFRSIALLNGLTFVKIDNQNVLSLSYASQIEMDAIISKINIVMDAIYYSSDSNNQILIKIGR